MEIDKNQKAQRGISKSILFMVSILAAAFFVQNSARADLATPFVEMNNQVGDISEAHGWVVTLGSKLEDSKYFYVIVNTDTMDQVVIGATAEKGVVKESLLGRWVIIKAQVTSLSDAPRLTHANIQLKILSVKSAEPVNEKPTEVQAKAISSDMEKFIKFRAIDSGMPYDSLKKTIKKDQLPLLYKLLDDQEYAPYWHNIARMIGYISDDPNSIPVLLDYFQRNDGEKVESIGGKIYSIALIGKIGGEKAEPILKKAITKEGVEELAKSWINEAKWKRSERLDKNYVITSTQGAALRGLVFTGKKENWDIVEKLYNEQKEISLKGQQTDIMSTLVETMAINAYIADHKNDVESYFRIDMTLIALRPYLEKYTLSNISNR
jgi:hypothetical protein